MNWDKERKTGEDITSDEWNDLIDYIKSIDGGSIDPDEIAEQLTLSLPYTIWSDDLDYEKICNWNLEEGETFRLIRMEFNSKDNNGSSDCTLRVFDVDNNQVINTITQDTTWTGNKDSTSGTNIEIQINNQTGSEQDCMIYVTGRIIEE